VSGRTRAGLIRLLAVAAACATGLATGAAAQTPAAPRGQYRAFWVDTFNTRFSTPTDVAAIVARAQQAHANVLFVQVRRRGDAWYLDSREPLAEGVVFTADFDPLREILARAHAIGVAHVGSSGSCRTAPRPSRYETMSALPNLAAHANGVEEISSSRAFRSAPRSR